MGLLLSNLRHPSPAYALSDLLLTPLCRPQQHSHCRSYLLYCHRLCRRPKPSTPLSRPSTCSGATTLCRIGRASSCGLRSIWTRQVRRVVSQSDEARTTGSHHREGELPRGDEVVRNWTYDVHTCTDAPSPTRPPSRHRCGDSQQRRDERKEEKDEEMKLE